MWAREVAKLDLGGSVILIRVDGESVGIVLLPFGLQSTKAKMTTSSLEQNLVMDFKHKVS